MKYDKDGKHNKNKKNDDMRSVMKALGLLTQLGLSMAVCVIIGLFCGKFLDNVLGTSPWLMIVFTFIGSGAAIKLIYDVGKDWK